MSISIDQFTKTEPSLLAFRFDSRGELTLQEIEVLHRAIRTLIAAGILASRAALMSEWDYGDDYPSDKPYVRLQDVIDQSVIDAGAMSVRSISFNNPYEMIAAIAGATLTATVVAQRCVSIFNDIQIARLNKAQVRNALLILRANELDAFRARDEAERASNAELLSRFGSQIDVLAAKKDVVVERLDGPK